MIETLNDLVAINSVSGSEYGVGKYLFDALSNFSPKRQNLEGNRNNITASRGKGKYEVALVSHMDTVPVSNGMKTPFSLSIDGDKAYGLGVADMKAGVTANLHTFFDYEPENFTLSFVSLVDEELWSKGVNEYLKHNKPDLTIFTEPYLKECVFNAAKGRFAVDLNLKIGSSHAAFNSKLPGFLNQVSNFLGALPNHQSEMGEARWTVSKLSGGSEFLSVPDTLSLRLNHTAVGNSTLESTLSDIKAALNVAGLEGEVAPASRPTGHPKPYSLLDPSLLELASKYGSFRTMDSVFDMNFTGMSGIPGFNLAVEGGGFHEAVEWVSIPSFYNIQRKLMDLLLDLETYSNS